MLNGENAKSEFLPDIGIVGAISGSGVQHISSSDLQGYHTNLIT